MLDKRFIRENPDAVKYAVQVKGIDLDVDDPDAFFEAIRAVRFMNEPQAADYLNAKSDALRFADKEDSRREGMTQFLDEKSYRPGLGPFKRKKAKLA